MAPTWRHRRRPTLPAWSASSSTSTQSPRRTPTQTPPCSRHCQRTGRHAAQSTSRTWRCGTARACRSCSRASRSACCREKRSDLSAAPAVASRRSYLRSSGWLSRRAAPCLSTASTLPHLACATCAPRCLSFRRTPSCTRARCAATSTRWRRTATTSCGRCYRLLASKTLLQTSRAGWTSWWSTAEPTSRWASASSSASAAPCCAARASSCSTRQQRALTWRLTKSCSR
mmetsp:Transcript_16624/g.49651  ORF Transcript_16624/g.49651 Transcript_16624/m.49651 type:complete len:229 (-) Transcript_16624:309-995(-)